MSADELCWACKKVVVVNWGGNDCSGPPMCSKCADAMYSTPKKTLLDRVIIGLTWRRAKHNHIDIGGSDPYSGNRWTIKFGKLEIVVDNTIIYIGQIFWKKYTTLVDWREYEMSGVRKRPLLWAMVRIHSALEDERERRDERLYQDNPDMHDLSYYE